MKKPRGRQSKLGRIAQDSGRKIHTYCVCVYIYKCVCVYIYINTYSLWCGVSFGGLKINCQFPCRFRHWLITVRQIDKLGRLITLWFAPINYYWFSSVGKRRGEKEEEDVNKREGVETEWKREREGKEKRGKEASFVHQRMSPWCLAARSLCKNMLLRTLMDIKGTVAQ